MGSTSGNCAASVRYFRLFVATLTELFNCFTAEPGDTGALAMVNDPFFWDKSADQIFLKKIPGTRNNQFLHGCLVKQPVYQVNDLELIQLRQPIFQEVDVFWAPDMNETHPSVVICAMKVAISFYGWG